MRKKEVEMVDRIEKVRQELHKLINSHKENILNKEVVEKSKELDRLLTNYTIECNGHK